MAGTDLLVLNGGGSGGISEYTTAGTTVNASLISGLNGPVGLAVVGNDLFVVNSGAGSIGEDTTSGATIIAELIPAPGGPNVCG